MSSKYCSHIFLALLLKMLIESDFYLWKKMHVTVRNELDEGNQSSVRLHFDNSHFKNFLKMFCIFMTRPESTLKQMKQS